MQPTSKMQKDMSGAGKTGRGKCMLCTPNIKNYVKLIFFFVESRKKINNYLLLKTNI